MAAFAAIGLVAFGNLITNDYIAAMYIISSYERGTPAEAISGSLVDTRSWPVAQVSRAIVVAQSPEGRGQALAVFEKIIREHDSLLVRSDALKILLNLGLWSEAKEMAAEWLESSEEEGLGRSYVAYVAEAEGIDEQRLLESAGPSRNRQCDAHFLIGLKLLAQGNPSARQHFEACQHTIQMNRISFCWARALLSKKEPRSHPRRPVGRKGVRGIPLEIPRPNSTDSKSPRKDRFLRMRFVPI